MKIIKQGNPNWNTVVMRASCIFCDCEFEGSINDGDFTVLTDDPKRYTLEATCPSCGNKLKL